MIGPVPPMGRVARIAPGRVVAFMDGGWTYRGLVLAAAVKHVHEPTGLDTGSGVRSATVACTTLCMRRPAAGGAWYGPMIVRHELWTIL